LGLFLLAAEDHEGDALVTVNSEHLVGVTHLDVVPEDVRGKDCPQMPLRASTSYRGDDLAKPPATAILSAFTGRTSRLTACVYPSIMSAPLCGASTKNLYSLQNVGIDALSPPALLIGRICVGSAPLFNNPEVVIGHML